MTEVKTNVFIGGAYDGQHREILDGNRVRLADGTLTTPAPEYRRETLVAEDAEFLIWVETSLTLRQAMAYLITGYRAP